jgi:ABC-type transport system involved in multi-copper enzyme maturation permease subunit
MLKALALKELRELAPIAGLGLLAYAWIVGHGMGYRVPFLNARPEQTPFVSADFVVYLTCAAIPLALALGFRQSIAESLAGTWNWLLHRPLPRTRVFAVKLLVGGGVYALCTALPIVWYAAWAAAPGKHASPFFWSMTADAWLAWLTIGAAYVASFLCGIWPGRWFGTRILALAGAGFMAFFFAMAFYQSSMWPMRWIAPPLLVAGLASGVFFVARSRDFS